MSIEIQNIKRDLYKELKDYDYNLYTEAIRKSEMLCCALELDIKHGTKVEKAFIEFALQTRGKF